MLVLGRTSLPHQRLFLASSDLNETFYEEEIQRVFVFKIVLVRLYPGFEFLVERLMSGLHSSPS